ncbi:MAG: branched-chain amino acid ABC transporter permease [Eubacteriales bacterium]
MGETAKTTAKLLPAGKSGIRRFLNADRVAVLAVVIAYAVVAILVYTGSATRQLMNMLISVSCYIVLALSLNLVVGLLGELSLGHAGFMSVGLFSGCTVAVLLHDTLPVIVCLPLSMIVGGLAAALVGLLVGLPALRLRGDYLAIVTLACGEIIKNIITNLDIDGTPLRGALGIDTSSIRMSPSELLPYAIVLVLVTMLVIMNFKRSKHGRAIMAIRDNRIAAEATGVNVTYYKLMVFVLASLFAGMAGVLYGYSLPTTEASLFDYNMSIEILVIVVLGGMGNLGGSIIAAIILRVLPEALRDFSDYRMLAYSILLIGIMLLSENKQFKAWKSQVSFRSLWNKVRAKFSKKAPAVATADAAAEEPNPTDSPKGGDGQ